MPADHPTCATCRWWQAIEPRKLLGISGGVRHWLVGPGGECRIRSTRSSFPARRPDDWCGEHTPVAPVAPAPESPDAR